jgi:homocitrate synthase
VISADNCSSTGVDGVDIVIGTSSFLRKYSHGKDITYIIKSAIEVIEFVKSKGIEVRFSSEDSFRSDLVDLLSIYRAVDKIGVNRVGIADTVGCANPRQVYDLVRTLRGVVSCDIECHFHDDSGCGESCLWSTVRSTLTRPLFQPSPMPSAPSRPELPTSTPRSSVSESATVSP